MRLPFATAIVGVVIGLGCATRDHTDPPTSAWSLRAPRAQRPARVDNTSRTVRSVIPAIAPDGQVFDRIGQHAMASVVDIHIVPPDEQGKTKRNADPRPMSRQSAGSGVIIASDGLILTNEHVVRDAAQISVALSDGSRHAVTRVAVHPKLDLAVLRIDARNLRAMGVVGAPVQRGATVAAIGGASFLKGGAVRDGIVTHTRVSLQHALDPRRTRLYDGLIETTARIEPGFSGGALIDSQGKLVGINVAVSGDPDSKQYRGYAIPCRAPIRRAIAELMDQIRDP